MRIPVTARSEPELKKRIADNEHRGWKVITPVKYTPANTYLTPGKYMVYMEKED